MQRCSDTIGALAGALAKAQAELTNPVKSLTATIPALFPREAEKTFRYAPLVGRSGHGPKVSQPARNSRGSDHRGRQGGWLRSSSPPCWRTPPGNGCHPIGRSARSPRRPRRTAWAPPSPMPGAIACSALVGIAGEDDIDAPDLPALIPSQGESARPAVNDERKRKSRVAPAKPVLAIDASANRRDELLLEIATLSFHGPNRRLGGPWLTSQEHPPRRGCAAHRRRISSRNSPNCDLWLSLKATPLSRKCSSPSEVTPHATVQQQILHRPATQPPRFRALRCHAQTAPTARQAPPRVCRGAALCCVRTPALRRPSSTLHTTQGTRSQSQR